MADTKKPVLPKEHKDDTVARGDHGYDDLKDSYSDVKDVEPGQVLSEQEVPEGWPTGHPAEDKSAATKAAETK